MSSDLLPRVKEICRLFDIHPQHSKGQNFLVSEETYEAIVEAADIQAEDTVIEVGPGLGFLTMKLAAKAKKVIAVELDERLVGFLQSGLDSQEIDNVKIVNQDILKFNLDEHLVPGEKYKIVANLPYNISSVFLRLFLSSPRQPQSLTLMLQKEVVKRLTALPPDMSILSVSVQYYGQPYYVKDVPAADFWPQPKVDSAVVKIDIDKRHRSFSEEKSFFHLVRCAFSSRRKMLKNNLASGLKIKQEIVLEFLEKAGLPATIRAEALSLDDWQKLFAAYSSFVL